MYHHPCICLAEGGPVDHGHPPDPRYAHGGAEGADDPDQAILRLDLMPRIGTFGPSTRTYGAGILSVSSGERAISVMDWGLSRDAKVQMFGDGQSGYRPRLGFAEDSGPTEGNGR